MWSCSLSLIAPVAPAHVGRHPPLPCSHPKRIARARRILMLAAGAPVSPTPHAAVVLRTAQVLSRNEAFEDKENAYYRTINISTANHKHIHAAFNRRLRPLLERLPGREREWRTWANGAGAARRSRTPAKGHELNGRRAVRPWPTELRCYARKAGGSWAKAFSWVGEFCRYQSE